MYTLALILGKCVATLRGAFFGVFLNETRFFIIGGFYMLYERKRILTFRLLWTGFLLLYPLILAILALIALTGKNEAIGMVFSVLLGLGFFYFIIVLLILISFFTLNYKIYDYNGTQIIVYAGASLHYIKVNGVKFDEHNTWIHLFKLHFGRRRSCKRDDFKVK